jgi:hypothetical protein
MKIRLAALLLALLVPAVLQAQNLNVRLDGGQIRIASADFRFITGDTLKRIQDGASVAFTLQVGTHATRGGAPRDLISTRFVVSYDLWEEKYAVTRPGSVARSASYLSLQAAEQWCLDLLSIPIAGLSEDSPFWVSVAFRVEEPAPSSAQEGTRPTLGVLVDIFSRRSDLQSLTSRKEVTGGPFRLSELRRNR